ncbi:MAG: DNA polymerase III subunit beta [Synergistaceae bacterium]|nr:DNA polymerase III subunit beta [Synergistaceae bacterium]
MILELNCQAFLKAWNIAEKSAGTKNPKDSVTGILINAYDDGNISLEATDLKTSVKCKAQGVIVKEPGNALVPVVLLGSLLRKSASDTITLDVNNERGLFIAGRSKARFNIIPVDTFPNIPDSAGAEKVCEIMAADLAKVINEGSIASSQPQDFPKYLGTCLLRTSKKHIKSAATDGKRLSLSKTTCNVTKDCDLLLPAPPLKDLAKMIISNGEDTVKILSDNSTAWFVLPEAEYSIRLIDSSFPNYERILNNEVHMTLRVSRDALSSVVDRVDIIARTNPAHIMAMAMQPSGEVRITARSPDMGTSSEFFDAIVEGGYMQIGFNVSYFQDGLKALGSGDIVIEFSDEEGQCRMYRSENDDFLYMLMPVRLSNQDAMTAEEIGDFSSYSHYDDEADSQQEAESESDNQAQENQESQENQANDSGDNPNPNPEENNY